MSDAFFGEIRAFGFNFAPRDWAYCWGQPLAVSQYQALFTVISTLYGGDGRTTFNVPDLRGRDTCGTGSTSVSNIPASFTTSQVQGASTATIAATNMPAHTHQAVGAQTKNSLTAGPAATAYVSIPRMGGNTGYDAWTPYANLSQATTLPATSLSSFGGNAGGGTDPHSNVSPYLAMNFCICLNGAVYPTRE